MYEHDAELYVCFVDHGSRDLRAAGTSDVAQAQGFILARNARPATLRDTDYSDDTLVANLDLEQKRRFANGRVVIVMESCFSGEPGDGKPLNPSMSVHLLAPAVGRDDEVDALDVIAVSAAAADTPAYRVDERGSGLFTSALVEGLRRRADAASGNNDGTLTFEELCDRLETAVPNRAARLGRGRQAPQICGHATGPLVQLAAIGPAPRTEGGDAGPAALTFRFERDELVFRAGQTLDRDWDSLRMLRATTTTSSRAAVTPAGSTCRRSSLGAT